MISKSCDVPTKSVTSLFYAILSHHTSEHAPKPCSPRSHWRCRPWNRRGRASNRQWDTKLEQPRQQKWNVCLSVSHQADGILHGEGSPSGSHCSSIPWRRLSLKWSISVLGGPWRVRKWGGAMPITTFADGAKKQKQDVMSDMSPNDLSKWPNGAHIQPGHSELVLWVPLSGISL